MKNEKKKKKTKCVSTCERAQGGCSRRAARFTVLAGNLSSGHCRINSVRYDTQRCALLPRRRTFTRPFIIHRISYCCFCRMILRVEETSRAAPSREFVKSRCRQPAVTCSSVTRLAKVLGCCLAGPHDLVHQTLMEAEHRHREHCVRSAGLSGGCFCID